MARVAVSLLLAFVSVVGPSNIVATVLMVAQSGRGRGHDQPAVTEDDSADVSREVRSLSPESRLVWRDMFLACATALRADSVAEPAIIRTLESMRRFHAAVGRFAWRAVGGNAANSELSAALEKLFASRFGDADRVLTADDRENLAATYEALAALAK